MNSKDKRSFFSVLFVAAIDNFGFGIVFIMFPPLLLGSQDHVLPADTSVAIRNVYLGILFAAYPLTQLFGAPILGDFADRAGRKKAFYITITGVAVGFVLSAFSALMSSIYFLIFSRLFTGFFSGNLSICLSAIADLSPDEKVRSRNFGIITVVWGISWTFAMLIGGYLSDPTKSKFFNPALPFWITTLLTLLSMIAMAKYYSETHQPKKAKVSFDIIKGLHNIIHAFRLKHVRPYFLVILFWTLGWGLAVQWFGAYSILIHQESQVTISWAFLIQGLFWMIGGSILNPLLLKRYKTGQIATIAFFFCTFILFFTMLPGSFLIFCLIFWGSTIFSSVACSNSMNLASIHSPAEDQGKIMGLTQSMMSLGWVLVPIVGGYVGGKNAFFFYPIAASLLLIGLLILLWELYREKSA